MIITEDLDPIYSVDARPPLSSTQKNKLHVVLSWEYIVKSKPTVKFENRLIFEKGGYISLRKHLEASLKN